MTEEMKEFYTALSKAQAKIKPALKDAANPFFKSKYAPLQNIWEACIGPLTEEGFCIFEVIDSDPAGSMTLVTTLAHKSGGTVSTKYPIRPAKIDPQGYGSAISYARRYSLAPLVGVVVIGEDDDGNEATNGNGNGNGNGDIPITKEQIDTIFKLANSDKETFKKLFGQFKVTRVQDIKSKDYKAVINWLNVFCTQTKPTINPIDIVESPYDHE